MTRYPAWALLLAYLAAYEQVSLFSVNGTTETPVASTYQFGNVTAGDS